MSTPNKHRIEAEAASCDLGSKQLAGDRFPRPVDPIDECVRLNRDLTALRARLEEMEKEKKQMAHQVQIISATADSATAHAKKLQSSLTTAERERDETMRSYEHAIKQRNKVQELAEIRGRERDEARGALRNCALAASAGNTEQITWIVESALTNKGEQK